ncbi:hypothetical protein QZH41_010885, partial [Actinostola sp. cb2023]
SYIYIEGSDSKVGDKARLASGWLSAKETLCLQFWYHMYGRDIGSLRILMKTNQSEDVWPVIWHEKGNEYDVWRFGQTPLKPDGMNKYQIIIEGEAKGGFQGDIAVDDIKVYDGSC